MSCSHQRSILVVEDNPAMGMVLQFNLEQAGFDVTLARDGLRAVAVLRQHRFDLIITDYQMPGMTGAELCRHIRRDLGMNTPIVLCSAKGMEVETAQLLVEFELERVFYKPFSPVELVEFVGITTQRADSGQLVAEVATG